MVTWLVLYVCLHILHPYREKHYIKELSIISLRPLTHPRLTVNLILTFYTQFQLFALLNKLTCSQPMNVLNFLHVYYYNCNNNLMLCCLYKTVSAIKTKDYTKDRRTTTSPECAPGNISIKIFV